MSLSLREKQAIFSTLVARLILRANEMGYGVTLGEAWRSPQEAARLASKGQGIKHSLHTSRLAIDLNLFSGEAYLADSEAYKPLGDWWKQQSFDEIACCWGGDFTTRPDGNHFSIAHGGRK